MILSFLQSFIVSILTGFLAISSLSADYITAFLDIDTPKQTAIQQPSTATSEEAEPAALTELPTYIYGGPIPNILIQNAKYQQASVSESATGTTVAQIANGKLDFSDALVNIYCTYTTNEYQRTTAGSGFFITPTGVILTNAHVAQFLLLENVKEGGTTKCIVRAGDPATPLYEAELLYISPLWVNAHASLITNETPRGTGERDYALLYVSGSVGNTTLPNTYPSLNISTALLPRSTEGKTVTAAGYPGEKLYTEGADAALRPVLATTTIQTLYTFGSKYADIFSISESSVGEHGASGGPVINSSGEAIGLITTKGNLETEGAHSLRAITLSYVDRTIREETGYSLSENLSGNLSYRAQIFKDALIPILSSLLTNELDASQ